MCKTKGLLETVEKQNEIIRCQSNITDELFALLMQHISAEEAAGLPVLREIEKAALMRQDIGGW